MEDVCDSGRLQETLGFSYDIIPSAVQETVRNVRKIGNSPATLLGCGPQRFPSRDQKSSIFHFHLHFTSLHLQQPRTPLIRLSPPSSLLTLCLCQLLLNSSTIAVSFFLNSGFCHLRASPTSTLPSDYPSYYSRLPRASTPSPR